MGLVPLPDQSARPWTPEGRAARHAAALDRAGNVFMWAIHTGPAQPEATVEGAVEQIVAMYLAELARDGQLDARAILEHYFPEKYHDARDEERH